MKESCRKWWLLVMGQRSRRTILKRLEDNLGQSLKRKMWELKSLNKFLWIFRKCSFKRKSNIPKILKKLSNKEKTWVDWTNVNANISTLLSKKQQWWCLKHKEQESFTTLKLRSAVMANWSKTTMDVFQGSKTLSNESCFKMMLEIQLGRWVRST